MDLKSYNHPIDINIRIIINKESLTNEEIKEEIKNLNTILNEQLYTLYNSENDRRNQAITLSGEYIRLKMMIKALQLTKQETMKTKVDLGCGIFGMAKILDTKYIFIKIGHGLILQLTLVEGLQFIDKKIRILNKRIDDMGRLIAELKIRIDMMIESIEELQHYLNSK